MPDIRRWHRIVRIRRSNPLDKFTLFRVTGPDEWRPVRFAEDILRAIQPQVRLTFLLIRTVTLCADPVEQRADLTTKINRLGRIFHSPDRR